MSLSHFRKIMVLGILAVTAGVLTASATTTQWWEVSSFNEFKEGDFEGTIVTSAGEIKTGWDTVRRELAEDAGVWAFAEAGSGDIFLGTGNSGTLYMLRGPKLYALMETESVVLTALAIDKKGNLYAAGMPDAEIYRFTPAEIKKMVKKASETMKKDGWKKREYKSDKKGKDKKDKEKKDKKEKKKDEKEKKKKKAGPGDEEVKKGDKKSKKSDEELKDKGKKKGSEKKGKAKKKAKKEKEKKKRKGPEPWVTLEDADQVWSLMFDKKRNLLFAGTGPDGKVFSIDASGRVNLYIDTEEKHVFSMVDIGGGSIAAGTGNDGKLLLIEGAGRGSVLWDFDATEVKSVVHLKQPGSGKYALVCAVNKFKKIPSLTVSKPSISSLTKAKTKQPLKPPSLGGEGKVAAVFQDGGMRVLFEDKKTHFTFMQARKKSGVVFSDGQKGRIFEVDLEGNYSILFDLEERQVLSFCVDCKNPFIGTSDPAAIHRIAKKPPATPYYVSDVFDAGFPARWGKLVLRAKGKVSWQTRSGNTSEPDRWWTDWSKPVKKSGGDIQLKPGRFMQFRLKVSGGTGVWNAKVFYLPANQQAVIKEINTGGDNSPKKKKKKGSTTSKKKELKHDPVVEMKWKVDNPDGDVLQYRLFFAKEGEEIWIPILKEDEKLTETKYKWDTTSIPAGYYLIKVEATDEPANDPKLVISHTRISKPILVDNDPPQIWLNVSVKSSGIIVSGKVTDNFSNVGEIQYSIDGKPWKNIFPSDLIFDEQSEPFKFFVSELAPGAHTLTLRALDEAKNLSSTGDNFVIK